jgi:hypothetical protein
LTWPAAEAVTDVAEMEALGEGPENPPSWLVLVGVEGAAPALARAWAWARVIAGANIEVLLLPAVLDAAGDETASGIEGWAVVTWRARLRPRRIETPEVSLLAAGADAGKEGSAMEGLLRKKLGMEGMST